ncbi:hypothetical protein BST33_10005 [Mycolicibacter minnesotensis]|uniref:Uncharacterized protein n=1 Tax=Mycolicibacter minnesotensis TaxID=1118379 RepID=A0A7I7R5B8_9MYCO|nr:helix-turn-helix domain-containing protein [Mycolicibacter minnesotensis]ORB01093.1 hypothetical protein BST33_10005 [Mycolicibacter minnesotensis]BBY33367.1 hypothetical protein MMIN_14280 [Mycolicibacter minnesotensis]
MNATRNGKRFFWSWLLASAAVSISGVIVHALLGDARVPVLASAVATVIVLVQLCAIHGVHLLVEARIGGAAHRCALAAAALLATGAFVLNFAALRDLVMTWAGIAPSLAWIAPAVVDLGMSVSTLALFALTASRPAQQVHNATHAAVHSAEPPACADAHLAVAHRIVDRGVVRISPERVAQVLAEHSAGAAPSMIARRLGVGYSTVTRILDHHQSGAVA